MSWIHEQEVKFTCWGFLSGGSSRESQCVEGLVMTLGRVPLLRWAAVSETSCLLSGMFVKGTGFSIYYLLPQKESKYGEISNVLELYNDID